MSTREQVELPWRWAHYKLYGPVVVASVLGEPVPQGSIRSLGKGRPSIHSNGARLLPWRESVQHAFEDTGNHHLAGETLPIEGPVAIDVTFTVRKPASAPKRRRTWPIRRPDGDKLLRTIFDAAQAAGIVRDDSQFIDWHGRKVFPLEAPQSLPTPGVHIFIYTVGE